MAGSARWRRADVRTAGFLIDLRRLPAEHRKLFAVAVHHPDGLPDADADADADAERCD